KIIRRKLMPNLKDVTWRYPTLTPSRLAISSRLIPWATKSLISSITSGVNCTPSAPKDGPALVIVMATPRVVVVFLVDLVADVRCDGHHEMVGSGYNLFSRSRLLIPSPRRVQPKHPQHDANER